MQNVDENEASNRFSADKNCLFDCDWLTPKYFLRTPNVWEPKESNLALILKEYSASAISEKNKINHKSAYLVFFQNIWLKTEDLAIVAQQLRRALHTKDFYIFSM